MKRILGKEFLYNPGRFYQQLSMNEVAVQFYTRVLEENDAPKVAKKDELAGEIKIECVEQYDLKRLAAHNLAIIYQNSGNG